MNEFRFRAEVRDKAGEWLVMGHYGTPSEARSTVVRQAGAKAQQGWRVVGMNRREITVEHPDDPRRRIEFRISKEAERDKA